MAELSQKQRVLRDLRRAGKKGVRSDAFYKDYIGRPGARVFDLKVDGHEISSRPEKGYVRYTLVEA